jgi:NifU-like protein
MTTAARAIEDPAAEALALRRARIEEALEVIRPYLRRDGGDVELVEVAGRNVYVRMTGTCAGCALAAVTVGGIQARLAETLGELIRVLPDTFLKAG